jgi:hypothetical protein
MNRTPLFFAALFATTALAADAPQHPAAQPGLNSEKAPRVEAQPQGGQVSDRPTDALPISGSSKEIHAYLTKMTNETIKATDPMARVTDMLAKSDRERIHGQLQKDYPDIEQVVSDFRTAWREKYNDGFDMGRAESEFAFAGSRVLEGEISDQAMLASERLGPDAGPRTGLDKVDQATDKIEDKVTGDKKVATVQLPASREQKLESLSLHVADEGTLLTDWRLNTPDTLTAQRLHDNLKSRLTALLQSKDKWPAEQRDAYRVVSHQILAAISDQPMKPVPSPLDSRQTGLDVED